MAKKKGKFIVIDGGDGCGKSTVSKEIVRQLGWVAVHTREPGGSPYAEKIRELILSDYAKHSDAETQFALFWAARRDHLKHVVIPAVNDGKVVICERFDSATYAYQIKAQGNIQLLDLFWKMREQFVGEYTPDAYILLDIDPETGLARVKPSDFATIDHFEKRKIEFHEKVNEGLREFISTKVENGTIVDAKKPLDTVIRDTLEVIHEIIK